MKFFSVLFAGLGILWGAWSSAQLKENMNLLPPSISWTPGIDSGGTKMELQPSAEAPLAVRVAVDGVGEEDFPKLTASWPEAQNWEKFMRLKMKVRVTSDDPDIKSRPMAIVFYDENTRREDLPDRPMTQQVIHHGIPVGRWIEISDWLLEIRRSKIRQMQLYLYEFPRAKPTTFYWEFAQLELEGVGAEALMFDTEVYDKKSWPQWQPTRSVGQIKTADGFAISLDERGNVVGLTGVALGRARRSPAGLLVRDVEKGGPPVPVGGRVEGRAGLLRQKAELRTLGLSVEATMKPVGNYIEVAGVIRDTTGKDRAITVYWALPVGSNGWRWADSISETRTKNDASHELSYLERGMQYGLNGSHSKYPLGALTSSQMGMTLAIRMDEPVVHRIGYSVGTGLFYVAFDFGLVSEKTIKGRSLAEAPFRILMYRHDPRWGFRSALQRYYDFFPEFFVNRIPGEKQGGWFVWGDMRHYRDEAADSASSQDQGSQKAGEAVTGGALALQAGFRLHWGPGGAAAVKWDNDNGVLALQYIEAEFHQQTMGDYAEGFVFENAWERLKKVAAGDEEELAKFEKLGYARGYVPGKWIREHSLREALITVSRAALNSVNYEADGTPTGMPGQYPWMSESKWGIIFPCNLDPDIPQGKGAFCRHIFLETGLQEMQEAGARYDGIALDSFGGYGQLSRANYRREHFQYVDTPLTFSALDHKPVIAMFTSTVEWLRELARDMHARGLVLMANCSWYITPGWLTFAAPYLDVFGAEAPLFADPDFIRAIARHRVCTDLPYKPVADEQLQRNLLHGIFPGHGNKPRYMAQFAATFRELAQAGWEPLTQASVTPSTVRMERFGKILVLHNPQAVAVTARVNVDGKQLAVQQTEYSVSLAPKGTTVLRLQ